MNRVNRKIAVAACIAASLGGARGASAQADDSAQKLSEIFTGGSRSFTLTYRAIETQGSWRRFRISASDSAQSGGGGLLGSMMGGLLDAVTGPGGSGTSGPGPGVYFTHGEVLKLGGDLFIVAYQPTPALSPSLSILAMASSTPPVPKAITPDAELSLCLVNVRTAGHILDIRPFSLKAEIAASESTVKAVEEANKKKADASGSGSTAPELKPEPPADAPTPAPTPPAKKPKSKK